MADAYSVRLYENTGFNHGNVPADVSVLAAFTYRDYEPVFKFQDRYHSQVRIHAEWEDVENADYLRMSSENGAYTYYVIDYVQMTNPHTAELNITMDPLLSAGGINAISVVGGWTVRAHQGAGEAIFDNVLPEPFQPSQRLIIRNREIIHDKGDGTVRRFVAATADIVGGVTFAKAVETAAGDAVTGSVVFPELPGIKFNSSVGFKGEEFELPGICLFDMDASLVQAGISSLRSVGIESAIVAMYAIPRGDVTAQMEAVVDQEQVSYTNRVTNLVGSRWTYDQDAQFPYIYGTVKNAKACALFNTYAVVSISSSNKAEFKAQELYSGGTAPVFRVDVDPAPNGTAYCQPTYFEGKATEYLEHSVAGLPWLNAGFVYEGASGGALSVANARRQNSYAEQELGYRGRVRDNLTKREMVQGANLGYILDAAAAPFRAIGAGVGNLFGGNIDPNLAANTQLGWNQVFRNMETVQDIRTTRRQMGENLFSAESAANLVAPEIAFPVDINASAYFGNAFMIYQTTLGNNDLQRFDKFLTMYGYAQDKAFTKTDLTNRQKFNYIKTAEAQLSCPTASRSMCEAIAEMFNNGVRVWHIPPTQAAYDDNPVVTGG